MARLLVFGLCPLPFENMQKNFGPGIRAWQFIQPILTPSNEILLIANRIPFIYPDNTPPEVKTTRPSLTTIHVSDRVFHDTQRIQELHDRFHPDAILCATIFASVPVWQLQTSAPVWIDLFGHVMAEAQAKVFRYQDDQYLEHFRHHELEALNIGDVFSTVSQAQGYATIGELGLINRLNASTTGYDFCRTIPCAMEPVPYQHDKHVFRGTTVPDDAFVVLWSGGYNTWTDVDTLMDGLEIAMSHNPDIWFVSTGGQIDGHDERTYPEFIERVNRSPHSHRFVIRGWVPKEDVHNYYLESNIGINIDRFMYEGMFGSKNRVLDWMRAALPCLIGELCELSIQMPALKIGYSYPLNNPEKLAEKLLQLAAHPDDVAATGRRAQAYGFEHLSFSATTQPFQEWLTHPTAAPDHAPRSSRNSFFILKSEALDYTQRLEKEFHNHKTHIQELEQYVHHLEREIQSLQNRNTSSSPNHSIPPTYPPFPLSSPIPLLLEKHPVSVSVIIVTWNGIRYLKECLDSVVNCGYPAIQCIVVDNGSSDGSATFIRSSYPQFKLIVNSRNQGFPRGVNQGIHAATGDVMVLLNQDAILQTGAIQSLIIELEREPMIAIAGCKILNPDARTLQHAGGILHDNGLTDHYGAGETDQGQFDEDRDCDYVTGAAFAFKSALIREIGYFDERFTPAYFEELDFCVRARRKNYRIRYVHTARVLHHESTSTGKFSTRFYYLYHRNRLLFMLKHFHTRYILTVFRQKEQRWIQNHLPPEQLRPLVQAYLRLLPRFGWIVIRDSIRRFL